MSRGPSFKDVANQDVYAGDWVFWAPSGSSRLTLRQIVTVRPGAGCPPTVIACAIQDAGRPVTYRRINPEAVGLYRSR